MSEDFLQFIWEHQLMDSANLFTLHGEPVKILEPGQRNHDSGPDFFNAKVKIGDTLWAGNVEIHRHSSDWYRHQHQGDEAYDSIILHAVHQFDQPVFRENGEEIPTIVMNYPIHLAENYRRLLTAKTWIPCQNRFHAMDPVQLKIGFNRLMIERLQDKTAEIRDKLTQNQFNWTETFYQLLARNFGFKINRLPFELLARSLPFTVAARHRNDLFQMEALFFGQSGLLHEELLGDDYYLKLRDEYGFLHKKYDLRPISAHLWKFLRLRPVNFPTLRIAQFATLMSTSDNLFAELLETADPGSLLSGYHVQASEYWDTHYRFNYTGKKKIKRLGTEALNNIIINTVVPFLYLYGEMNSVPHLRERALEWMDTLPPENNSVTEQWRKLGVQPRSAFESQALLLLKSKYCDTRQCLRCHIGNKLIRHNPALETGTGIE